MNELQRDAEEAHAGKAEVLQQYKDLEKDGLWTSWYENGQKNSEITWKDGQEISRKEWDKAGNPE